MRVPAPAGALPRSARRTVRRPPGGWCGWPGAAAAAVVAALLLGGCGAVRAQGLPAGPVPPAGRLADAVEAAAVPQDEASVRILSIHPSPLQPLQPGQRLRVVVEVAYVQPGASATLALSVQEGPPGQQPLAAALVRVTQPRGVVTLSAELRVPEVSQLRVFVPLYLRDGEVTTQVDQRRFEVRSAP